MSNFSFDTVSDFDDHINLSIPNYDVLQRAIVSLSSFFLKEKGCLDIGCSTGALLRKISQTYEGPLLGVDISENLIRENTQKNITLLRHDITDGLPDVEFDFATCVFTLQFLPPDSVEKVLKEVYQKLPKGGGLVVCEKTFMADGFAQELMTFSHYDYKTEAFSAEEIFKKQISLRKIMTPVSEAENIKRLRDAGFKNIIRFWQSFQFIGWLCIK